jgi:hypothetical protein
VRLTILTIGSCGDVQPYTALGLGLQAARQQIKLATFAIFEEFIRPSIFVNSLPVQNPFFGKTRPRYLPLTQLIEFSLALPICRIQANHLPSGVCANRTPNQIGE